MIICFLILCVIVCSFFMGMAAGDEHPGEGSRAVFVGALIMLVATLVTLADVIK